MVEKRSTREPDLQGAAPVGVVLAGGGSRRMGRDKASLVVDGRTLAERAAETLARVCPEVLAAAGGRRIAGSPPDAEPIADGPGEGPAAGILGAARERPGRALLVLACDVPRVPAELLAHLVARWRGGGEGGEGDAPDVVVPRSDRGPEPLVALYGPRAVDALARQVAAGEHAVRRLLEHDDLRVVSVEGAELARFGDPERMLANVNTPTDFRRLG